MPEPTLAQQLAATAALLLRPPDAAVMRALRESHGIEFDPDRARQDFYDVLCVSQSGRYIPPYAHVLVEGRLEDEDWWYFPPPRFDGGDALVPWYDAVGFDPQTLAIDPMLRGPHRPLDSVGFLLAYLAGLVASENADITATGEAEAIVANFISRFLDVWVERFCTLMEGCASPYLAAVAEAVREVVEAARKRFPSPCIDTPLNDVLSVLANG